MLRSARLVDQYAAGVTYEYFDAHIEKQDAIIRRIELIGEAANQISEAARVSLPDIDWRRIIGMRHFVVHQYRDIDLDVVWRVVTEHVPQLIRELERILVP